MVKGQGSIEYIYLIGGVLIVAFIVVILMISLTDDSALVFPDFLDDRLPGVRCGDGQIEGTEACDDDNNDPGDGCSSICQRTDNADGCSKLCEIETGWTCIGEPSVCT